MRNICRSLKITTKIRKNTKNNKGFDKKIAKKTCEARIRLTKKGMLLANDVFVEFI